MKKVRDLQPGDLVDNPVFPSLLVAITDHPLASEHKLLVWWMDSDLIIETMHQADDVKVTSYAPDTLALVCRDPRLTPKDL